MPTKSCPNPVLIISGRTISIFDVFGFYTDSSNDYKLLHMVDRRGGGAFIYSRRSDSWRKIKSVENSDPVSYYWWSPPTFSGQSLYFMMKGQKNIICFDVITEKFREIPPPPAVNLLNGGLVVIKGCLHLFVTYECKTSCYMTFDRTNVWRMDGDGWMRVAGFSDSNDIPLTLTSMWMMKINANCYVVWLYNRSVCITDWKKSGMTIEALFNGISCDDLQRASKLLCHPAKIEESWDSNYPYNISIFHVG